MLGGMGSITQAMASAARAFGAEVVTEAPVVSIDVRDGRARGVVLEDGRAITASVVVSNADQIQFGIRPPAAIVWAQGSATAATGIVYTDQGVVTFFN